MGIKYDIAAKLARQFPKAANRTLARVAFRDNKGVWPNLESARQTIRVVRGNCGKHYRKFIADRSLYRQPGKAGAGISPIPKGLEELPGWAPLRIAGPTRALILSDIHAPYHSADALGHAISHGLRRKANLIILNGDIMDGCAISHWQRDPRERDFPVEVQMVHALLGAIRTRFSRARIIWKDGNHEERYRNYMITRAPELLGLPDFELASVLHLKHYGVEYITDRRPILLGNLTVMHGHEWGRGSAIHPAKSFFDKASTNVIAGHFHRPGQWYKRDPCGTKIESWATGCLCDMRPRYATVNQWQQGFAFVEADKAGGFEVENVRL